jgi:peptidoglycan/LPS O-acetylase OafA/YrhL
LNARNPRFPLVDSVRAIAALTIFAYHVTFHHGLLDEGVLSGWRGQLNIGVAIFFVVSGFLLYRPYASARYDGAPPPPLLPYAARRVLRIVPAYWVALPLVALMLGLSDVLLPHGLVYFGFLQVYDRETIVGGIGPAWTLCIEVTFYAALPLFAVLARRVGGPFLRSELGLLAAVAAASFAWKVLVLYAVPADTPGWLPAQVWLPTFADHFAVGMALAVVSVAGAGRPERIDRFPWLPWLLAAIGYVALSVSVFDLGIKGDGLWRHELRGPIGALVLAPAVFGDPGRGAVRWLLSRRWLLWLGTISYGFYLWHQPIIVRLARWGWVESPGKPVMAVVAFAATASIAALSWYVVERPALRLGRERFGRRGADEIDRPVPAGAA